MNRGNVQGVNNLCMGWITERLLYVIPQLGDVQLWGNIVSSFWMNGQWVLGNSGQKTGAKGIIKE